MRLARWVAAVLAIGFVGAATLGAHPQSTTEVSIVVASNRRTEVVITADAEPLARKLEALGHASLGRVQLANLETWSDVFLEHVVLRADGAPLPLVWTSATLLDAGRVSIRLETRVPASTTALTWSSSLVFGAYPVVMRHGDMSMPAEWLQGTQASLPVALDSLMPPRGVDAIWRYFVLGFTHILPNGFDHILFVVGLFLLNRRTKPVLMQISAFTIAHSITLGLSLYGVVRLPAAVVEPLIALSIAYVAVENLFTSTVKPWRVALVFGFGLLHGMGFAEALARLNLPRSEFFTTLVTFNVGVEAGQLTVIAVATAVVMALRFSPEQYRLRVVRPVSAAIAALGVFWTLTRLPWF